MPKPSFAKGGNFHMYTLLVTEFFCIPKTLAASRSPVSTQSVFTNRLIFSRKSVPLGFCCGGFSSTAGYVPGNEAHSLRKAPERLLLPLRWFLAEKCFVFLSAKPRKNFSTLS
jgi:hypothetical protein